MDQNSPKIAVLGAGVVGMTVATILQERLRNADVQIIAEKFHEETTSSVAAGIFRPGTSFRGLTQDITKKWVDDSWNYWHDILKTAEAPRAGIMSLSGYIFSQNYNITRNHLIEELLPIYRPTTDDELKICGKGFKFGSFFSTVQISCDNYLPWSEKNFIAKGGKIVKSRIDSFASLKGKYDLIFNCLGLGAKYLCNDHDLVPIRGQVIKVRAPWLKMAYYGDYDTYILPGINGIATLGGVRQYDSYNTDVCKHDAAAIYERCCELLPPLKNAEIVGHRVGLRPHRVPVRVEGDVLGSLRMVHCYGHGGYGVTCAPGTAIHAVDIGLDLLRSNMRPKL